MQPKLFSLKELVEKHGFGISVRSISKCNPTHFVILREDGDDSYMIRYEDSDDEWSVLRYCENTNDYYREESLTLRCDDLFGHHPLDGSDLPHVFLGEDIEACRSSAKFAGWVLDHREQHGDNILSGNICPKHARRTMIDPNEYI